MPEHELDTWLRGVARNLIATHWRTTGRAGARANPALAAELAELLVQPAPALDQLTRDEARDQLLLALTELASDQQDLLIDHYFGGRPLATLAGRLGVSERAVEGRLYRARQGLREMLIARRADTGPA